MTESELNLLAAFQNYDPGKPIEYTYRVYYNKETGLCTRTDVVLHDEPFVEVDRTTFEGFNPNFYRVVDGKIKPREIKYTYQKILKLGAGPYRTLPGCGMFLVEDSYTGETDSWTINYDN